MAVSKTLKQIPETPEQKILLQIFLILEDHVGAFQNFDQTVINVSLHLLRFGHVVNKRTLFSVLEGFFSRLHEPWHSLK